jgi:hypothetical protein
VQHSVYGKDPVTSTYGHNCAKVVMYILFSPVNAIESW